MIRIQAELNFSGCAQGKYTLRAKGFILAVLRWGDGHGAFQNWSQFAYVPIDPAGNGAFFFPGMRAIPPGATHVWARCYTSDFSAFEDASAAIADRFLPPKTRLEGARRFSILSDLHLSARPWHVRQALRTAQSDTVFLLGDSTNDGLSAQFDAFQTCIDEALPAGAVFPVIGNHDVPRASGSDDGCAAYAAFQNRLLSKAENTGYAVSLAPDGRAYSVLIDNIEILALQCVTAGRKFQFPEDAQLDWLENRLNTPGASWRIILCHAPLLKHNPNRNDGAPYLGGNKRLQALLDRSERVVFLSGHTHVSPNVLWGNAEYDAERENIYLDCASAVTTDISGETGLMAPDWNDGCITELCITQDAVEIHMSSISSGTDFARGYYFFSHDVRNFSIHALARPSQLLP